MLWLLPGGEAVNGDAENDAGAGAVAVGFRGDRTPACANIIPDVDPVIDVRKYHWVNQ
jgi:hypothetical protein